MNKLTIDLIPRTSFFTNLRILLTQKEWDIIRKQVYKNANYKCEICGGKGRTHPVECHEQWEYDSETKTQKLIGLIALCPPCHSVTHIGLAEVKGNLETAIRHLAKVNSITIKDAYSLRENAFKQWNERNKIKWTLDTSLLPKILEDLKWVLQEY